MIVKIFPEIFWLSYTKILKFQIIFKNFFTHKILKLIIIHENIFLIKYKHIHQSFLAITNYYDK